MSATIDPTHFAKYFSLPIGNVLCPAPVLDIEKLTNFKVGEFYINQLKLLGTVCFSIGFVIYGYFYILLFVYVQAVYILFISSSFLIPFYFLEGLI